MQLADYYNVLGVQPGADQRAIKSAYRRLARRYHPDVAKSKRTAKTFLLIREAYEVLSDPERRRQYDRLIAKPVLRRPPSGQSEPSRLAGGRVVEASEAGRGFDFVLKALGIRIGVGVQARTLSRSAPAGPARRRKRS